MSLDSYTDKPKEFDLKDIVLEGHLNISSRTWRSLNKMYTKEEIKKFLSDAIDKYNIPLPMKTITIDDCYREFLELRSLDSKSLVKTGLAYTKVEYKWSQFRDQIIYLQKNNTGNKASDYFQQENRMKCAARNYPSPYDTWHKPEHRKANFEPLWSLKMNEVNDGTLLTSIQMKRYIASQFRPSSAKAFYDLFGGGNILDFSSGWGDRLCGFYASNTTKSYLGMDPNSALFPKYYQQVDFYGNHLKSALSIENNKSVRLVNKPAEDVDMGENDIDICFTSPPYLFVEKYANDEMQSCNRYTTVESWLTGFLFATIDKVWRALKHGGVVGINISDVIESKKIHKLCDPLNDYIKRLPNSKFEGMMGYELAKRPNTGYDKIEGALVEPIWVWKKE